MKNKITLVLMLGIFVGLNLYSQSHNADRFKTLKIGFITETLELTSDEAEKFWPIYNLHQDKIYQWRSGENRKLRREMRSEKYFETLRNEDAEILLNKLLQMESDIQQEQSAMFATLRTILPSKKLLKLYKAEHDFNRKILEQHRKRLKETR